MHDLLRAARAYWERSSAGSRVLIAVTNARFELSARSLAAEHGVELIGRASIG